jgi:hypothetical protein
LACYNFRTAEEYAERVTVGVADIEIKGKKQKRLYFGLAFKEAVEKFELEDAEKAFKDVLGRKDVLGDRIEMILSNEKISQDGGSWDFLKKQLGIYRNGRSIRVLGENPIYGGPFSGYELELRKRNLADKRTIATRASF